MSGGASTPVLRQAGNQKQQGYFFPTSGSRTPCTVISELWAGWLIALPGASFTCTKLFSPQSHCPWLASLVQLHPDCECYDLSQLHNHAPPPQWCFIQGGLSLVQRLPPSWVHTVNILISMDAEPAPLPAPWSKVQLWHSSYGGVISGHWSFITNKASFVKPAMPMPVQRRIRHIIDWTHKVRHYKPVMAPQGDDLRYDEARWIDIDNTILDWNGLLPKNHMESLIRCQMIYTPSKWAVRKLTLQEMMISADIPEQMCPKPERLMQRPLPHEIPFYKTAPIRLLTQALQQWTLTSGTTRNFISNTWPSKDTSMTAGLVWPQRVSRSWKGASSAAKSDDAQAPYELWDKRVWTTYHCPRLVETFRQKHGRSVLDCLREVLLRVWRHRVTRSFLRYLKRKHGVEPYDEREDKKDRLIGRECITKAAQAEWFEWTGGSTPFFWRWPVESKSLVRDGHAPWFMSAPPKYLRPQRGEPNEVVRAKVREKLSNVKDKGYISAGTVKSLTSYFAVAKGDQDIRMVYDASASGLNACLWVPTFALPSADALLELLTEKSWMSDLDMGEQFLNFPLHEDLQAFCGIDVRPYFGAGRQSTLWLRWTRCMMGLRCSPYMAVKATYLG